MPLRRRSIGVASSRCCSGSNACCPRTSRTSRTARSCRPTRSTRFRDADRAAGRGPAQRQRKRQWVGPAPGPAADRRRPGSGGRRRAERDPHRRMTTTRTTSSTTTMTTTTNEDDEDEEEDDELEDVEEDEDDEDDEDDELDDRAADDEEPVDWQAESELDEDVEIGEQPEDPNADRRFWFEHATGAGKTVAALGFVEASRTGGVLILTHRRNLVDQFNGELRDRESARPDPPAAAQRPRRGQRARHRRDLPVVRAQRRPDLRRVHDRDLRRGPHGSRREDVRVDPRMVRSDLHRDDRDRRADRPPRHRPVPDADLALRPRAGGAPRRDRAASLHPDPARTGRPHDREGAAAPRRGGHRIRPGDAGRTAGPDPLQRGDRRPLQDALQRRARRRLRRRRAPRLQRREGVPGHRHQGPGRLRRDAQAPARADPRRLRVGQDRRARQRAAAGRGMEQPARDDLHAPRADRLQAHLPAAGRPRHAPASGQGGRDRRGLRPPRDQARRSGGHAALAA